MVRTKKWGSEPCGLNVTISASCDWSVAIYPYGIGISGILPYKSLEIFSACTVLSHGSIMLPPHQPRVFARLARWQLLLLLLLLLQTIFFSLRYFEIFPKVHMVLLQEYSNSLSHDYNHDMVRLLACITVVTLYAEDPLAL